MVSWVGDGRMAGFDPTTNQLEPDLYHFATPGSVDLNAITRLDYDLPPGADEDDYPNRLALSATFNFTAGDINAHSGRWLVAGAFLASADQFPSGAVPTPQQILNLGYNNLGWTYSTEQTVNIGNKAFTINGWRSLTRNKKYWILLIPCFYNDNLNVPIRPMTNITPNTMGRVLSFWTNRTPTKPVITSPADGLTTAAGSVFNFEYTPGDPDVVGTTNRFNRDLAGVQVAYAEIPTQENPNPQFRHLYYRRGDTGGLAFTTVYMNQADVLPGDSRIKMLNNLGFPVEFGTGEIPELANRAAIPAGHWQIKVRTADYGNPYPRLTTDADTKYPGDWSMNVVPEVNLSPWSDPIKVHVFQQVPPPTILTPKDAVAIPETSTTRLVWLYRNTFDPPYDQHDRTVQIRHVGEPDWHTIYEAQISGDAYLELPPGFTIDVPPDPIPAPTQIQTDGGFESGGVGNWIEYGPSSPLTVENVAGTAGNGVHTGVRALRLNGTETIIGGYSYTSDTIPSEFNAIDINLWIRVNADLACIITAIGWVDVSGNPIGSAEAGAEGVWSLGNPSPAVRALLGSSLPPIMPGGDDDEWTAPEWIEANYPRLYRPPGGDRITVSVTAVSANPGVLAPADWHRIDDFSTVGRYIDPGYGSLTLEATNEYEWRAKVSDDSFTDESHSEYSTTGRFWIVPGSGTGEVKPVPENTSEGATLGCGTHRVFVYRRGAKERVGEITGFSHVDWKRVRDDISDAKVVISDWSIDCGNLLAKLQTWAYELVIFRDNGYTVDRVWEGPITLLTYEDSTVTIQAKDVMGYAYRRIIKQKMDDTDNGDTVVSRASRVLQNVFAPDDPNILAYLMLIQNTDDAKQYRSVPPYSRTAFEEVDDMAANSGLDYTAVGRSILLWGTKSRIGTLPEFRDEDLGAAPVVSEYGMSMANVYSVSDGNGIHGEATRLDAEGKDEIYGLVEMLSSTWASDSPEDTGTYSQEGIATIIKSFEEYAERSISDRYPPPVVVRIPDNTTLNPSTVLSIQQLVPGVVVPLRSTGTLRTVVADQKLDSVTVTEEAGKETITITLSPFSYDDQATPEGEGGA